MTIRTPAELAAETREAQWRDRAERAEAEIAMLRRELAITKSELRTSAAIQKQLADATLLQMVA